MADEIHSPRFSFPAVLFFTVYLGLLDVVDLALLLFGLDDFLITDFLAFPITQLYLVWKGARSSYNLASSFVELIPYVGSLPLRTIGFLFTVWMNTQADRKAAVEHAKSLTERVSGGRPASAGSARAPVTLARTASAPTRSPASVSGSAARVLR